MSVNQIVLTKEEQADALDAQIAAWGATPHLHLFTNNNTCTRDTVLGDLTEAAWTGYAAVALTTWPSAAEQGDGIHAQSTNGNAPTFLNSTAGNVTFYGGYITDNGGDLVGAFNTGLVTIPAGASEIVTPQMTQRSEYASSP
jgi:hypothetical protein